MAECGSLGTKMNLIFLNNESALTSGTTWIVIPLGMLLFSLSIVVLSLIPTNAVKIHRIWSLFSSFIPLVTSLVLLYSYDSSGHLYQFLVYLPGLHITLGLDGIGLSLVILTSAIFPLCIILLRTKKGFLTFLTLELLILGALIVLDLLGFYILFEATLVLLFMIISRYPYGNIKAAYLIVIYTAACSLVILPVIFALYSITGSTNLLTLITLNISRSAGINHIEILIGWGFILVFGVKIPLIPLHLWLPEAHVAAPTAGSVLLAGVLLKLGGLGIIRYILQICPIFSVYVFPLISIICVISFVYASLSTIKQLDIKKIIAYSSIAHISLVTLTIISQSEYSIYSSTYIIVAHGLVSPALFILVGALYARTHTKYVLYFKGLGLIIPLYGVILFIFTLANLSFPLFPNFIAEVLCLASLIGVHESLVYIFCLGQVLSGSYGFFIIARVLTGVPLSNITSSPSHLLQRTLTSTGQLDLSRIEFALLIPLLLGALWLGLKPIP